MIRKLSFKNGQTLESFSFTQALYEYMPVNNYPVFLPKVSIIKSLQLLNEFQQQMQF